MKSTDPLPYAVEDHVNASTMSFVREAGNGDRYYTLPARRADNLGVESGADQAFFYRAMHRSEAVGWMTVANTPYPARARVYDSIAALKIKGHQGWASYRNYSLPYLSPQHKYTHLLEVYAPEFIKWLKEIGVFNGKAESADISWGVGLNNSNAFGGNSNSNEELTKLYGKAVKKGAKHTAVKGGLRAMATAVTPYIFHQSMQRAKLVDLRSVRT